MTKEQLIEQMSREPPIGLLRDESGRFFETHYFGMGDYFAITTSIETASIAEEMLKDGELIQLGDRIACRQKVLVELGGNLIERRMDDIVGYEIVLKASS